MAGAVFGPFTPKRMDTCPEARFTTIAGTKNGEIRRGPCSRSRRCSRSIVPKPPIPDPTMTPNRSGSATGIPNPASSKANCAAASAKWMNRSIFRASRRSR